MTHEQEHVIIHKLKAFAANPKVRNWGYLVAFIAGALIF
jgi:hypothetical protein